MEKEHLAEIGKRVQELRKKNALTRNDLSIALGISEVTIKRIEIGNANYYISHLLQIMNYFDVSPDYLINGERAVLEELLALIVEDKDSAWRFLSLLKKKKMI